MNCLNCDAVLSRTSRKYCSNYCQQAYYSKEKLKHWLATGETAGLGPGTYARRFINEEQNNCCAVCGMTAEWLGKPLVMILDHINGDSSDNRRENLRLVCPNCDSQLPTYKARNKGSDPVARRKRYLDTVKFLNGA